MTMITNFTRPNPHIEVSYGFWAERLINEGWAPYFLTFMFRQLGGSPASIVRQMEREVERVYATHVTRVVRNPTAASSTGRLPVWFCSPDRPVYKHTKQSLRDVAVNDGLHMHATAFDPPWSRLNDDLVTHFEVHRHLYVRPDRPLLRLDVEPITDDPGYVVSYGRKAVMRGLVGEDATLILPRTRDEMRAERGEGGHVTW